ncbi:MAG TPA: FadR/GntR family transcriptional regulator [Hyphomicrobiaceae bacterium]|nr:FadR/GntR family transcriptional regulator [Hyphomicrobiaceae bacterium]
MPLAVIEPRRLYRQIADQLRQLIDDGEYSVGSRLPTERELAEQLGVSRPTVREALIALEVEGRLRIRVGSGIYVIDQPPTALVATANPPIEGSFEILRARAFVESAVAEEAAHLAKPADVARLDRVLAQGKRRQRSRDAYLVFDRSFHTAIAETLDNAVLVRFVGELFDLRINPYFEQLARHTEDQSFRTLAHQEHVAIRNAIAASDPAGARAAMHHHLERSHQRFARDFGELLPASGESAARPARKRLSATA